MDQKGLTEFLKKQKLGPEYMANLIEVNGIYRVDNSSTKTDNDLNEVTGGYRTKTIHNHPTSKEVIKISFYNNNKLHKVEIRSSAPDDRADQLNAQYSTSVVVDKNKIYIFNALNRLQVIK